MNIEKELKIAISTGNVILGKNKALKSIMNGQAKGVVLAKNIPKSLEEDVLHLSKVFNIKVIRFDGNYTRLGVACGKPYGVSVIAILEPGESRILSE